MVKFLEADIEENAPLQLEIVYSPTSLVYTAIEFTSRMEKLYSFVSALLELSFSGTFVDAFRHVTRVVLWNVLLRNNYCTWAPTAMPAEFMWFLRCKVYELQSLEQFQMFSFFCDGGNNYVMTLMRTVIDPVFLAYYAFHVCHNQLKWADFTVRGLQKRGIDTTMALLEHFNATLQQNGSVPRPFVLPNELQTQGGDDFFQHRDRFVLRAMEEVTWDNALAVQVKDIVSEVFPHVNHLLLRVMIGIQACFCFHILYDTDTAAEIVSEGVVQLAALSTCFHLSFLRNQHFRSFPPSTVEVRRHFCMKLLRRLMCLFVSNANLTTISCPVWKPHDAWWDVLAQD